MASGACRGTVIADVATIYTIGHSLHSMDRLVALLRAHAIELLVDVRSHPASRRAPHFSRAPLARALATHAISYDFAGGELGGRPDARAYYREDGSVDYARRREAPDFQSRIESLLELAATRRIAIMCAEEDPSHCHRQLLVAPALRAGGATILHIRKDGRAEPDSPSQLELLR